MILLLSKRKCKAEDEIIEILTKYGACHISDKFIGDKNLDFTILSIYKKSEVKLKKGAAVFIDDGKRFLSQSIPLGIIGICEDDNFNALEIFKQNNNAVITCGLSNKNSITISSIKNNELFICLQRSIQNHNGKIIEPGEFKISLTKKYLPFSVMASTAVLLLKGIIPHEF